MKFVNDYNSLPEAIKLELQNANIWYQISVFDYALNTGVKTVFFFDETYIIVGFIQKKLFFKYMLFYTEPFCYNSNSVGQYRLFLDEIVSLSKTKLDIDFIAQTSAAALFTEAPAKSVSIPFGSYIIDLSQAEEELWDNVHSKHRNVIRNAEKNGVKVVKGGHELLDDYLLAEVETCKRSNMSSAGKKFYSDLFKEYKGNIILFLAYQNAKIQGGAIFYYNSTMAYYMHGASVNKVTTGAINLLLWEAIKFFKTENVRKFSFVGARINEDKNSKYHGIQNFKKRFGGELFVGKMFKVVNKPWKYKLYKFLLAIKTRGTINKDIIDQEIQKWQ